MQVCKCARNREEEGVCVCAYTHMHVLLSQLLNSSTNSHNIISTVNSMRNKHPVNGNVITNRFAPPRFLGNSRVNSVALRSYRFLVPVETNNLFIKSKGDLMC